jgi:predicted RNA-binding Zn-ribbon protein involved in translation (DUF1610 family)
MEKKRTLFEAMVQDRQSEKTTRGAVKGALGLTLGGVLCLGVSILVMWLVGAYWYFVLGAIAGAGLIIYGLATVLFSLFRPTKITICPKCKHEHEIYRGARSYVCTNCNELLLLGEDTAQNPGFSTCPCCGLKTAVSGDADPFLCPDCGILRRPNSNEVGTQKECPGCGFRVPAKAIYCVSCGKFLKTDLQAWTGEDGKDLVKDLDWRAGKSPRGHFIFSKAILNSLNISLNEGNFEDIEYSPFDLLDASMISLEVAANNEKTYKDCGTLLPELDKTYGRLLNWELSVIESVFSESDSSATLAKVPIKDTYIAARQRLEELFGEDLQACGSIGKWNVKLLEWEEIKSSTTGASTGKYQLVKYDKLKQESSRFAEWVAKLF